MSKIFDKKIIIFVILLLFLIQIVLAVPNSMNVRGKLTSTSGAIQTGTFNFTFRIYDNITSGNVLYERGNISSTTDARGVYDLILENINVNFDRQLYLGIEVNVDGEMSPRVNLTSVPYSFKANESQGLNTTENVYINNEINLTTSGDIDLSGGIEAGGGLNVSGDLRIGQGINLTALGNIDASGTISVDTLNVVSTLNVGGGFDLGGLTIQSDGDIVTTGDILFSGNITIVNVSINDFNVNGSVTPGIDNTFDLGNESFRWRSIYAVGMNLTSNNLELVGDLNVDTGTLFVDSALNRVGIGTTSPNFKLDVAGPINASGLNITGNALIKGDLNVTGTSYLGDITINADNITTNNIVSRDGNISFFNDSGNELMRITSLGRVGIGTTDADNTLDIKGTGAGVILSVERSSSTDKIFEIQEGGVGAGLINIYDNSGNKDIVFATTADSYIRTGKNLGIGTTTPSYKLEVAGNMSVAGFVNMSANVSLGTGVLFVDNTTGRVGIGTSTPQDKLHVESTSDATIFTKISATNLLMDLSMNSGDEPFIRMRDSSGVSTLIDTGGVSYFMGGNIGIGTSGPGEELDIKSTTPELRFNDSDNSNFFDIGMDGTDFKIYSNDTSARGITIDLLGNVGIGTTTTRPGSPLTVQTSNATTEAILLKLLAQDGRSFRILQPDVNDNNDFFTFFTNNAYAFRIDNDDVFVISATGPGNVQFKVW